MNKARCLLVVAVAYGLVNLYFVMRLSMNYSAVRNTFRIFSNVPDINILNARRSSMDINNINNSEVLLGAIIHRPVAPKDMDNNGIRNGSIEGRDRPKCPSLPCAEDCQVKIEVSETSNTIHVGGEANTWRVRHHVTLLVLKPGLCKVASKSEFNLVSPFKSSPLYRYVTGLPSGTVMVGIIMPGNYPNILSDIERLLGSGPSKKENTAKAFVHMRRQHGNHKAMELDISTTPAKWSVNTYIGQPMNISLVELTMAELEKRHPSMRADVGWSPPHCQPQSTIAIIIPFRDRESHLRIFLNNLIPFLQRQMLAFQIFIIDQVLPKVFNRALLMNVGYLEAKKRAPFDCYVFHDVDLMNEDACNLYTCSAQPRHLYVSPDKFNYNMPFRNFFGGATILDTMQLERMNGFPNVFYGWGGEDDNIFKRITLTKQKVLRNRSYISRYSTIKHGPDKDNPKSGRAFDQVIRLAPYYPFDGLNNTEYTVAEESHHQLFNRLRVEYDGPADMAAAKTYLTRKEGELKRMYEQKNAQLVVTEDKN